MPSPKNPCPECGHLKSANSKRCRNCAPPNKGAFQKGCNKSTYIKCATPECSNITTTEKARGLCNTCSNRYRKKHGLGAYGRWQLTCKLCGNSFLSRTRKPYCSMYCYTHSSTGRANARRNVQKATIKNRAHYDKPNEVFQGNCVNCGNEYTPKHGRSSYLASRKCCSRKCSREYFAARFDRFMANPETLCLPQAYDEFLTQETLHCLVEGCEWEGKGLSNHMNMTHGVPKALFKELAGFNRKTGVIPAELSERFSKRRQQWHKDNVHLIPYLAQHRKNKPRPELRLEGREHARKSFADNTELQKKLSAGRDIFVHSAEGKALLAKVARATAKREAKKLREQICVTCGKTYLAQQRYAQHAKFCSTKCANADPAKKLKYQTEEIYPAKCAICNIEFLTTRNKVKAYNKGERVYCSAPCKKQRHTLAKHVYKYGEENASSKLTLEEVDIIRKEQGNVPSRQLAKRHGVSKSTILGIWNNKTWTSVVK